MARAIDFKGPGADARMNDKITGIANSSGQKIISATRGAAVTAPTGGATVDAQSRTAITDLISRLQAEAQWE